jgi:hypothetical protein
MTCSLVERRSRPKTGEEKAVEQVRYIRLFHHQSGQLLDSHRRPTLAHKRMLKGVLVNFLDKLPGFSAASLQGQNHRCGMTDDCSQNRIDNPSLYIILFLSSTHYSRLSFDFLINSSPPSVVSLVLWDASYPPGSLLTSRSRRPSE